MALCLVSLEINTHQTLLSGPGKGTRLMSPLRQPALDLGNADLTFHWAVDQKSFLLGQTLGRDLQIRERYPGPEGKASPEKKK